MTGTSGEESITDLLRAAGAGDRAALDSLFPLVYGELTILAHRQRNAWHGDPTLNTTGLVHEAYLKISAQKNLPSESRAHFFGVAAKAMRHILCNHARDRGRLKRGGDAVHVPLDSVDISEKLLMSDEHSEVLASLDEALKELEEIADRQARVVECRFFGAMSVEDTAAALGISERTVKRDWTFARAWLRRAMQQKLADTNG